MRLEGEGGGEISRINTPIARTTRRTSVVEIDQEFDTPNPTTVRQVGSGVRPKKTGDFPPPTAALDYTQTLLSLLKSTPSVKEDPICGFEIIAKYIDNCFIRADSKTRKNILRMGKLEDKIEEISSSMKRSGGVIDELKNIIMTLNERCAETWKTVIEVENKCNKVSESMMNTRKDLEDKFRNIEEWLTNLKRDVGVEIPAELIESVKEVMSDTLTGNSGEEVDELRREISRLKKSSSSDRFVTEGLRKLVINLKGLIDDNLSNMSNQPTYAVPTTVDSLPVPVSTAAVYH